MGARPGAKNKQSKLTAKEVKAICKRLDKGESYVSISEDYNVTPHAIGFIARGETWSTVTGICKGSY